MSRDEEHGGSGWAFKECLWAPTHKDTGGKWAFWDTVAMVRSGDVVLHLRGRGREAHFVGTSTAATDGFTTTERPPNAKSWSYANSYYRVNLRDFEAFITPISLYEVFRLKDSALRDYFNENKLKPDDTKERLFYVIQAGRLQCLNGAYLSSVSSALFKILIGDGAAVGEEPAAYGPSVVLTRQQLAWVQRRVGQAEFSDHVRRNFGNRCCFPECEVADDRLLVGAHIARWADDESKRGLISNGLCLCLHHDKAFELGMFTVTSDYRVHVEPKWLERSDWARTHLAKFSGYSIRSGKIMPSADSLALHWTRTAITL